MNQGINDEGIFKPDEAMGLFLYLSGVLLPLLCVLPWSLPVGLLAIPPGTERLAFMLFTHIPLAVTVAIVIWWAPRYYASITYSIGEDWLIAEGGVFWRKRVRLPVDRVQLVDVLQGPLQRRYGLASVSVFTAATGQSQAELRFVNLKDADRLRDQILFLSGKYRSDRSGLASTGVVSPGRVREEQEGGRPHLQDEVVDTPALEEIRAIRRLLEKHMKE